MSGRPAAILDRFPRHLEAGAPGKLFGAVVEAAAQGLDVQTTQIGKVRRSHRLSEAEQEADLVRLAELHGFTVQHLDILNRRVAALVHAKDLVIGAGADPTADLHAVADALGLAADMFAPFPAEGADLTAARARLALALQAATAYDPWLDQVRTLWRALVAAHRTGNGTVRGLLDAAASYVGCQVQYVDDSEEGFWHLATCREAFALHRPNPPGAPVGIDTVAGTDIIGLEENPFQFHSIDPVARRHGDRFRVLRGGFDAVPVTVVVRGVDDRTLAPMVVNIDTGFGVATTVAVAADQDLRFERDGRATLGGAEVTRFSFTFAGGVFADGGATHPKDFVWADADDPARFGDRAPTFSVTQPIADAFDDSPTFPHSDALIEAMTMDRGESRWAFFVGTGTFAGESPTTDTVLAAPHPVAGFYDQSVFEPDAAGPPAGLVGFEWDEREPFSAKLWLPLRLAALDAANEVPVRERLRILLDRHRPAGVHLYVDYADPRWTLGTGTLRDLDNIDPVGTVVTGTTTWEETT